MKKCFLTLAILSTLFSVSVYPMETTEDRASSKDPKLVAIAQALCSLKKDPATVDEECLSRLLQAADTGHLSFKDAKDMRAAARKGKGPWKLNLLKGAKTAQRHLLQKLGVSQKSLQEPLPLDPQEIERVVLSFNANYGPKNRISNSAEIQQLVVQHMGTLAGMLPDESDLSREITHVTDQFREEGSAHISHHMGAFEAITQELLRTLEAQKRQEERVLRNTLGAAAGEKLLAAVNRYQDKAKANADELQGQITNAGALVGMTKEEKLPTAVKRVTQERDSKKQVIQKTREALGLGEEDEGADLPAEALKKFNEAIASLQEAQDTSASYQEQCTTLDEQCKRLQAEVTALIQELNETLINPKHDELVRKLEEELRHAQNTLSQTTEQLSLAKGELANSQNKAGILQDDLTQKLHTISRVSEELQATADEHPIAAATRVKGERDEQGIELERIQQELEAKNRQLQEELERKIAKTEKRMVDTATSCDDLGKQAYAQLREQHEQTKTELRRITKENDRAKKDKEPLEAQVNAGNDENGQLERIRALEAANLKFKTLLDRAAAQIRPLKALNEAFQREVGSARAAKLKAATADAQTSNKNELAQGLARLGAQVQSSNDEEEEDDDSDFD